MTDREKIIETLRASGYGFFITHEITNADDALAGTADALIANGIGDVFSVSSKAEKAIAGLVQEVKEWKERAEKHRVQVLPDGTIKQLYSDEEVEQIVKDRDEWKRSAEVAEKEREEYRRSNRIVLRGIEIIKRNIIRYCAADFPNILQQAEREIEEERE